jgi:hypothetical protein
MILRNLSNRAFFRLQVQSHYALFAHDKTKTELNRIAARETYKKNFGMKATSPRIFSTKHSPV